MCQVSNNTNENPSPSVELICISSVEAREAVEEGCRVLPDLCYDYEEAGRGECND